MAHVKEGILHEEWLTEDVSSLDESLTEAECVEVLKRVAHHHDAHIGINWDVIQYHIDNLKEN